MKSILGLMLLFGAAYIVMMFVRLGARRRAQSFHSIHDFNEAVSRAIRDAGSHDHLNPKSDNYVSLMDLCHMRWNMWLFVSAGSILQETAHLECQKKRIRMEELCFALQNVSCSFTYKLFLSVQEIIRGRFRPDTQYLYTQEVEHSYCVGADILETMADLSNKPLAARLRRHLA